MTIDVSLSEGAEATADAVAKFCSRLKLGSFNRHLWAELADLGVLSITREFDDDRHLAMVAAMEQLGRVAFPGPLAASLAFVSMAPDDLIEGVASGNALVSLGRLPLMPFAPDADIFVTEMDGRAVLLNAQRTEHHPTLSGEVWGKIEASGSRDLGPFDLWCDLYDVALSGWLVGAGLQVIEAAAQYASERRQFGRPIGNFQAVALPLARAIMALDGAQVLSRAAAHHLDCGEPGLAPAARVAAGRAARMAAVTAHQTYGAFGVIEEGPVFAFSRRIAQASLQFPEERISAAAEFIEGSEGFSIISTSVGQEN